MSAPAKLKPMISLTCLAVAAASLGCSESFKASVQYQSLPSGERVAFYERGQGEPLLMLTGTGSTMAEWDPALLQLLSQRNRLILVDYPGLGLSSRYKGRFSFSGLAGKMDAFLSARGISEANVLGWSMGGFVAQRLAARGRVSRLILAGTNPGGRQAVLGDAEDQKQDSNPSPSDREVIAQLFPRTPAGRKEGKAFLDRLIEASNSGEIPDDFKVPEKAQRMHVQAEDRWLSSEANWRSLKEIRIPTLAAAGRLDRVTPPVNMRRIARRTGGEYREFPGSHGFLFSDRKQFTDQVNRFLAGT